MEKTIEILKKFICFILIAVSASFFGGCKKKTTEPNEVVVTEGETPATEAIKLAYDNFYANLNSETSSGSFAEGDGKTFYDEYIFASISIMREVSLLSGITENAVISGREFEIDTDEVNYCDKVAKLFISDKRTLKQHQIEMIIFCPRKNYTSEYPKNCIIFYYEIKYNEATKNTKITCQIEKSYQFDYSSGYYCSYEYDSKENSIIVSSFYKAQDINFSNPNTIQAEVTNKIVNFRYLWFMFNDIGKVEMIDDKQTIDADFIRNKIGLMEIVEDKASSLGKSEIFNESLTENLIYIINANDPSFFINHLSQ